MTRMCDSSIESSSSANNKLQNDNIVQTKSEILTLPILQKNNDVICVLVTFPTVTSIISCVGIEENGVVHTTKNQAASAHGDANGYNFDINKRFIPGDYCLALTFETKEETEKICMITLTVNIGTISNLMISQLLFSLYRNLGFDPSHVLKYPIKSSTQTVPFYRKTRSEIMTKIDTVSKVVGENLEKVSRDIVNKIDGISQTSSADIIKKIESKFLSNDKNFQLIKELINKFDNSQTFDEEKGQQAITITDLGKLLEERESYLNKLSEAEDYIEDLEGHIKNLEEEMNRNKQTSSHFIRRNKQTALLHHKKRNTRQTSEWL